MLIRSRGQVLSKELIIEIVWQGDAVSDGALYESIREARTALGDAPRAPKYIKTYSKKGYEWIHAGVHEKERADVSVGRLRPPAMSGRWKFRAGSWPAPAKPVVWALSLLIIVAAIWFFLSHGRSQKSRFKRLAALPFGNATGDAKQDWMKLGLRELVTAELSQLEDVEVTPLSQTLRLLEKSGIDRDELEPLTRTEAGRLAREYDVDWVIEAVIAETVNEAGDKEYQAEVFVYERAGKSRSFFERADTPLELPSLILIRLRQTLQPNLPEAGAMSKVIEDPTPDQAYTKGVNALYTMGPSHAAPFFEQALNAMPDFLWSKYELAVCRIRQGRKEEGGALLGEILNAIDGESQIKLEAFVHMQLSKLAAGGDQTADAWENCRLAHQRFESLGDLNMAAWCLVLMNRLARTADDFDAARSYLDEASHIYQTIGNRQGEGWVVEERGVLANSMGELRRERNRLEEALAIFREIDAAREQARVWQRLARSHERDGDLAEMDRCFDRAMTLAARANDRHIIADIFQERAAAAARRNDLAKARTWYQRAIEIAGEAGFEPLVTRSRSGLDRLPKREAPKP